MKLRALAALALLASAAPAPGQTGDTHTLELEGGARVAYTLRSHPPGAHLLRPDAPLAPDSALNAAKLLNLHLSTGDIEEAALLSNAPRRRFEELANFRNAHGEEEFKRVFAEYFSPGNSLVAEIVIGRHSLLIWRFNTRMKSGEPSVYYAGQFFVELEGRYLMDDVPNDTRTRLRWVLEAYRSGRIAG